MRPMAFLLVAVAMITGVLASSITSSAGAEEDSAPLFGVKLPPDFRDWKLISVAHEAGNLNDFRAVLGNDAAIKAYRNGTLPFPTAPSLPGWPGSMCRPRRTTKSSDEINRSLPVRQQTFNSW